MKFVDNVSMATSLTINEVCGQRKYGNAADNKSANINAYAIMEYRFSVTCLSAKINHKR
jgi:hypothetical protein